MDNDLVYRQGTLQDLPGLMHLGLVSYGKYDPLLTSENRKKLHSFLNDKDNWIQLIHISRVLVCTCDGKLAGMAFLIPSGNSWDIFKAEWSYIRMLGIDPAFEGRGIATKLTQSCIDAARQNGESTIALHTSEFMDAARHIYEKLGFSILFEMEQRLGKRYWLYTMDLSTGEN